MTAADDMLRAAAARADDNAVGDMPAAPSRRVAVLTCMDARIDPLATLGVERGEIHVIRNAGGLATDDAIRSLSISERVLGTEEVIVMMHEACGLCGASDEDFAALLAADDAHPSWRMGAFGDVAEATRESVGRLRGAPELSAAARGNVRGFVFDPRDGSLRDVA